jgi:hypothetical protein
MYFLVFFNKKIFLCKICRIFDGVDFSILSEAKEKFREKSTSFSFDPAPIMFNFNPSHTYSTYIYLWIFIKLNTPLQVMEKMYINYNEPWKIKQYLYE